MQLNRDIELYLPSFLDFKSASRLALTCSFLLSNLWRNVKCIDIASLAPQTALQAKILELSNVDSLIVTYTPVLPNPTGDNFFEHLFEKLGPKISYFSLVAPFVRAPTLRACIERLNPAIIQELDLPCTDAVGPISELLHVKGACPNLRKLTIVPDSACIEAIANGCPNLEILTLHATNVIQGKAALVLGRIPKVTSKLPRLILHFKTHGTQFLLDRLLKGFNGIYSQLSQAISAVLGLPAPQVLLNNSPLWIATLAWDIPPSVENLDEMIEGSAENDQKAAEALGTAMKNLIRNHNAIMDYNAPKLIEVFTKHVQKVVKVDSFSPEAIYALAGLVGLKAAYDNGFIEDELLSDLKHKVDQIDAQFCNYHNPTCLDDWSPSEGLCGLLTRLDKYLPSRFNYWSK